MPGYGSGTDLVWRDNNAADYAVKENFTVKVYKGNNVQHCEMKTDYLVEGLFGGPLLYFFEFSIDFLGLLNLVNMSYFMIGTPLKLSEELIL